MKKRIIPILIAIVVVVVLVLVYFVISFFITPGGSKKLIINSSESAYQQNIKIKYPQISKLETFTANGTLIFEYKLKDNTNEKIIREIFQKNYEFIINDNFIKSIIFQPSQSEYVKVIWVDFNLNSGVYMFKANKDTYGSGNSNLDNYRTWTVLKNNKEIDKFNK